MFTGELVEDDEAENFGHEASRNIYNPFYFFNDLRRYIRDYICGNPF